MRNTLAHFWEYSNGFSDYKHFSQEQFSIMPLQPWISLYYFGIFARRRFFLENKSKFDQRNQFSFLHRIVNKALISKLHSGRQSRVKITFPTLIKIISLSVVLNGRPPKSVYNNRHTEFRSPLLLCHDTFSESKYTHLCQGMYRCREGGCSRRIKVTRC